MIVFNTNQLNHFGYNNSSQHKTNRFNSQFNENIKQLNSTQESASDNSYSQKKTNPPLSTIISIDKKAENTQSFKFQLSLMAKFAIRQYETLSHFESQQETSSILGINEYA